MTAARDLLARYRGDFEAYAAEVERIHLYSRQRELVQAVLEHERVAVKAANAVGKSVAAAFAARHHLAGGPGSVVVCTSATDGQLRRVLMREVRQGIRRAGDFFAGAQVTEGGVFLADDWYLAAFATDQAEAMQGIHAERVFVVLDEASGVEEPIWDAIEGLLAGGDARVLAIGNPLRTSGSFFDAFNSRRDEWHTLTISAYDTPAFTGEEVPRELRKRLVSRRWVERLERRDRGGNAYAVKVLGEFPLNADDTVVSRADLEQAQQQNLEAGLPLVIGVDPARFGRDETAVALREGNRIRVVHSAQGHDLMRTTGMVVDLARRVREKAGRRPTIVVDSVGVGSGVCDRLRELREFKVVDFNSAGRATRAREYANKRAEAWFEAAEVLSLLDLDAGDEELARELLAPTYTFASDGARQVEAKANTRKRLRRSPDRADAVLLTLAVDPPRVPGRARQRGARIYVARGRIDTVDSVRVGLEALYGRGGLRVPGGAGL